MIRSASLLSLTLLAVGGYAADQPLGLVESSDQAGVAIAFEVDPHLALGSMVAIYAPGTLERHPLTKQVIIEGRKLIAKAQLTAASGGHLQGRVLWMLPNALLAAGDDVIPLPGEAAPNSPPVMGDPPSLNASAGSTIAITLPITDPDGDLVSYRWSLSGTAGHCGRLDALTTLKASVLWSAPATPGKSTVTVLARDAVGHEVTFSAPLTTVALDDPRKRDLTLFARWGADAEHALSGLCRLDGGGWTGISADDDKVMRIDPGWLIWDWVGGSNKQAPTAVAVAGRGNDSYLLTKDGTVSIVSQDGSSHGSLSGMQKPTSIAVSEDGTTFIADQAAGGIVAFEPSSAFRGCLGRRGDSEDAFSGLSRIAVSAQGEIAALDAKRRRIERFDHLQHRLAGWSITGDPNLGAVDLALHPRGVLLLMANGSIQIYDSKGLAREALPALSESGLVDDVGAPATITVDALGEILVTYPDKGYIARYSGQGGATGVRGPKLRERALWAADGTGRLYALDDDGNLDVYDAEGWLVARQGGISRKHCSGLVASCDGLWVEALDRHAHAVVRLGIGERKELLRFGQEGKNNGQFQDPIAISVDDAGRTYVLDGDAYKVSVFDPKGSFLFAFGSYGKGASDLKEPLLLAASPGGEAAFIYDDYRLEIKKFALDFTANSASHVTNSGGKGDGAGQLRSPVGIGCDRQGLLYVVDKSREDVQALDFHGNSAVAVSAHHFGDFGVREVGCMVVSPDGQVWMDGGGTLSGARWTSK